MACENCEKLAERIERLRAAAAALLADVHRRYPGEDLRCPFMRELEAALTPRTAQPSAPASKGDGA